MAEHSTNTSSSLPKTYRYQELPPYPSDKYMRIPDKNSMNFYVITKYICAMLNSHGGTLLIGLDPEKKIKGRRLNREDIDKFQRHVDEALKQFNPSVKGHEYTIEFRPVQFAENSKVLVNDYYIIEIQITDPKVEDLYFTHFDECWIKKSDSQIDIVPITNLKYLFFAILTQK
jgi:hypothetical protein